MTPFMCWNICCFLNYTPTVHDHTKPQRNRVAACKESYIFLNCIIIKPAYLRHRKLSHGIFSFNQISNVLSQITELPEVPSPIFRIWWSVDLNGIIGILLFIHLDSPCNRLTKANPSGATGSIRPGWLSSQTRQIEHVLIVFIDLILNALQQLL